MTQTGKRLFGLLLGCITALTAAPARAESIAIANAGFEFPALGPGAFQYSPTLGDQGGTGWVFGTATGVLSNGSGGFNMFGATGNQAAFLQASHGTVSQLLDFDGGWYELSFISKGRAIPNGPQYPGVEVQVGTTLLTFGGNPYFFPPGSTELSQPFSSFVSSSFFLAAGSYNLAFHGLDAGDHTTFVDDVAITSIGASEVPEPSTLLLLGGGLLTVVAARRRRSINR